MRILFDTNVVLDAILERAPFYEHSQAALFKADGFFSEGYILASAITDIYYISKKQLGHIEALNLIKKLVDSIDILNVDKDTILLALHSDFSDFEDAVQSASAELNQLDLIVSRNIKDFMGSKITALTPTDFLLKYKD